MPLQQQVLFLVIFGFFLLVKCFYPPFTGIHSPVSCLQADIICNKVFFQNAISCCLVSCWKLLIATLISPGQGNGTTERWLQHSWSVSGMLMRCCLVSTRRPFLPFKHLMAQTHRIPPLWLHDVVVVLCSIILKHTAHAGYF